MQSEYHCPSCNLNFLNEEVYERHKVKFCPHQDDRIADQDAFLRQKTSVKTSLNTSSNGVTNKFQKFSLDHQYHVNIDQLKSEADRLEKEKIALKKQLDSYNHQNQSNEFYQLSYDDKNEDMLNDKESKFQNSLRLHTTHRGWSNTDTPRNTARGNLLRELRLMRKDYEINGGTDQQVLQYFQQLESKVVRYENKYEWKEFDKLHDLQRQLDAYKTTNEDLLHELNFMKKQTYRSPHMDDSSHQNYVQRNSVRSAEVGYNVIHPPTNHKQFLNRPNYHEQRLFEMRQEAEVYRQQLELERLRQELISLRGHPGKPVLPVIGGAQNTHVQWFDNMITTENDLFDVSHKNNEDVFKPSPYDPGSGFSVFWDYASLPDTAHNCCRLLVALYKSNEPVSDTTVLPTVPCGAVNILNPQLQRVPSHIALLGINQLFPKCYPDQTLSLCIRLQSGDSHYENTLQDEGWCKIVLFDRFNRLVSGRWKVPIRILPMKPELSAMDVNGIPQFGQNVLYYRLVNTRDSTMQEKVILNSQLMAQYKYPPVESSIVLPQLELKTNHPKSQKEILSRSYEENHKISHQRVYSTPHINNKLDVKISSKTMNIPNSTRDRLDSGHQSTETNHEKESNNHLSIQTSFGIQVDLAVGLTNLSLRVKVSILDPTGNVASTESEPAQFFTKFVKPSFLTEVHLFCLHQHYFNGILLYPWSLLFIEIFEKADSLDDQLFAWTVTPLFHLNQISQNRSSKIPSSPSLTVHDLLSSNVELKLFKTPVITIKKIVEKLKKQTFLDNVEKYADAFISLHLYNENLVEPLQLPKPIPVIPLKAEIPVDAWVDYTRPVPEKVFENGDGFDLYVDCGRFLPRSTVASKVVVGYFDGTRNKNSPFRWKFETTLHLGKNSLEPCYNARFEFREFCYEPQAKLIFIIYILDAVTKSVSLFGQAIVPLFVKPHSFNPADATSEVFCLNQGGIQVKLYKELGDYQTFDFRTLKGPILCSSLLVRILPASCYADGQPKKSSEFHEDEWINEGILIPATPYEAGQYDSQQCIPTETERELLHAFVAHPTIIMADAVKQVAPENRKTKTEQGLLDWLNMKFKPQENIPLFNTQYLVKYNSLHGLYMSLVHAQNVTWKGFTFATCCMSPPCAFYHNSIEDPLTCVTRLNPDSPQRHPQWLDGVKMFPRRQSHKNLSILIHLYEVLPNTGVFTINSQAWTILPLLTGGYLTNGTYQLPVFQGEPGKQLITDIQTQPLVPTIATMRKKKLLKVIDGMSVFLKIGDARLVEQTANLAEHVNQMYLPRTNNFFNLLQSKSLRSIIPAGIQPEDYVVNMADEFEKIILSKYH